MNINIKFNPEKPLHNVSKYLLGQNLEIYREASEALLTDRLKNPKFYGSSHPTSGVAEHWEGHGKLIPGMGISTDTAQLVDKVLMQRGVVVKAGEELELEFWAKVRHDPVTITCSMRPSIMRHPPFAKAEITVDTAYYARYTAVFAVPESLPDAVFTINIEPKGGDLIIDQIHLRPVGAGDIDQDLMEKMSSLNMSSLRFPGGCITTVYQWQKGLGPRYKRPVQADPQFNGIVNYDFGIDEYLELCIKDDITPHLVVSIGVGTPDDARELADYCRRFYESKGLKPPKAFFQIGNEQFAMHSSAHMTGDMYVAALKAYVPPIRTAYPDCEIIAIGYPYSGASLFRDNMPWRTAVLDEAADLIDYISNHYYKAQWRENYEEQQQNAVDSVRKIRDDVNKMITDIKERGLNTKIAITEWNFWLYADGGERYFQEPMDPNHCLYVAGVLQMFCELGEFVKISNYYHLLNGLSVFTKHNHQFRETPLASVFRFYAPIFPGKFLPIECDSPRFVDDSPTINTICIQSKSMLFLYIVNNSLIKSAELTLPPAFANASGEALVFSGGGKGVEVFPEHIGIAPDNANVPPCSITRFMVNNIK